MDRARLVYKVGSVVGWIGWAALILALVVQLPPWSVKEVPPWVVWFFVVPELGCFFVHRLAVLLWLRAGGSPAGLPQPIFPRRNFFGS